MAKAATIGLILIISKLLLLTPNACARKQGLDDAEEITFFRDVCGGKEKIVKLEVYLHDLRVGNTNPTVFQVAKASITDTSATSFGTINAVDDLLTAGPDINSKAIGRIQGLTTSADLVHGVGVDVVNGVALNLNIVFTVGRFNGSTISILGRNQIQKERRELTVAGGTGAFRFGRGYAIQTTSLYDAASFYGLFKFTIYITYNSKFSQIDEVESAEIM